MTSSNNYYRIITIVYILLSILLLIVATTTQFRYLRSYWIWVAWTGHQPENDPCNNEMSSNVHYLPVHGFSRSLKLACSLTSTLCPRSSRLSTTTSPNDYFITPSASILQSWMYYHSDYRCTIGHVVYSATRKQWKETASQTQNRFFPDQFLHLEIFSSN